MKVPQQQQQQQPGFEIIKHGKLAYSSYYDILENHEQSLESAAEEALNEEGGGNNTSNHENQETCVRTCVFAPEPHDYVAWSCGYGLLRILRTSSSLWSTKANCNKQQHPIEIDAGEHITSLAFGSSKSSSARPVRRSQRTRSSSTGVGVVYRRFHFDDIPDKLILAVGLSSGRIRIYDPVQGVFLFGLFDHSDHVRHLKFTQDGSLQLCSASADSTLKLWNMYDDGNMYMTLKGHDGLVNACDWSPVDNFLCSVANRDVFIWSTDTYAIVHRLKGHLNDVVACQFTPDGGLLATASFDTKVCLWNPYTGEMLKQLLHLEPAPSFIYAGGYNGAFVRDLKWSANGEVLVTVCEDGKLRVWSLVDGLKAVRVAAEAKHRDGLCLAFSSKWRTLLVGNRNGYVERFEVNFPVPKLTALCRNVVNQIVDRKLIDKLCLPIELKNYLTYNDFKPVFVKRKNLTEMNKSY